MHTWKVIGINGQYFDYRNGREVNKKYGLAIFGHTFFHNHRWLYRLMHRIEYSRRI